MATFVDTEFEPHVVLETRKRLVYSLVDAFGIDGDNFAEEIVDYLIQHEYISHVAYQEVIDIENDIEEEEN